MRIPENTTQTQTVQDLLRCKTTNTSWKFTQLENEKKNGKKNNKRKINDRRDWSLELYERHSTVYKMHRREEKMTP